MTTRISDKNIRTRKEIRISMLIVLSNNNLLLQRNPLMVTKRDEPTKQGDSALKGLIIILCIIYQVTW